MSIPNIKTMKTSIFLFASTTIHWLSLHLVPNMLVKLEKDKAINPLTVWELMVKFTTTSQTICTQNLMSIHPIHSFMFLIPNWPIKSDSIIQETKISTSNHFMKLKITCAKTTTLLSLYCSWRRWRSKWSNLVKIQKISA